MVNLLPLGKAHLHNALVLFGSIVTVAAKLLLFSVLFGYWSNSKSFPASFKHAANLLMLHFVTTL